MSPGTGLPGLNLDSVTRFQQWVYTVTSYEPLLASICHLYNEDSGGTHALLGWLEYCERIHVKWLSQCWAHSKEATSFRHYYCFLSSSRAEHGRVCALLPPGDANNP